MRKPNIVFIVADDLGFADLGCYGAPESVWGPVSPNIDALALGGLRLTQGYANSPVCSPTRFALMTMRYQYRVRGGMEEPINSKNKGSTTLGLPPEIPTLPSLLRKAGYATALIGKWHLGYPPAFGPMRSGYDDFYGIMAGGADYFSHCSAKGDHDLYKGESEHNEIGYLTDLLSQKAVGYINKHAQLFSSDKPFFLSLHYTAPHWPWETRDDAEVSERLENLFHLDGGNIHTYQRMIQHMDEGIGLVVDALRKTNQIENTLIVFTSDNGGERFSNNWPLVGGKMDLTEGGIRVPWVAHWPAGIPAGSTSLQQCMTMDWSATLLDIGGGTPHPDYPIDGVSMKGMLSSPNQIFERPLYWRMNHRQQRAMRLGDWKYLKVDQNEYLFNLAQDERERANLANRDSVRFKAMREQYLLWEASVPPIPDDAAVSTGYSSKDMPQR